MLKSYFIKIQDCFSRLFNVFNGQIYKNLNYLVLRALDI